MLEKYKRKSMRKPEKLVIEGEAGAGKTTFACSSHSKKEPVFVINADDGGEHHHDAFKAAPFQNRQAFHIVAMGRNPSVQEDKVVSGGLAVFAEGVD